MTEPHNPRALVPSRRSALVPEGREFVNKGGRGASRPTPRCVGLGSSSFLLSSLVCNLQNLITFCVAPPLGKKFENKFGQIMFYSVE